MVTLLRQLFKAMNLPMFRPTKTGSVAGVSYVLLCEKQEYCFRGIPDFVVHNDLFGAHKDLFGVGRILVSIGEIQSTNSIFFTGEMQSTNRPDVQNSIYGIGALMNSLECGAMASPIVCVVFSRKCHFATKFAVMGL